jgi:transcriptional regulator with XRE-family HTH domain
MAKRTYPDLLTFLNENHLTQEQFARRLGISQSYMSKLIRGLQEPPLKLALRISRLARVPLESLVARRAAETTGNTCV